MPTNNETYQINRILKTAIQMYKMGIAQETIKEVICVQSMASATPGGLSPAQMNSRILDKYYKVVD